MPTVACYVRVSTEHQRENYSIAEQISRLEAFCKAKDLTIGKIYTDGGYSGGNLNRPALQDMLAHLTQYDVVLVYKLDRLSRSQKDTLFLIEDHFLAKKVDFISVCENFDTSTPFGRAMIGMLSVFAQLEKDQITERFTMGRIARAKNGFYHGGAIAPTGYDYINGQLIPNAYEAAQIQELYERFRQGHTIHDCWKYMQARYTTKYGGWKSETLIRNVLRNEVYIGKVKFQKKIYPGNHIPIISETLFYEVQELFEQRRKKTFSPYSSVQNISSKYSVDAKNRPFTPRTLLSGHLFCGQCGSRFHGEHGKYCCSSRSRGYKNPNIVSVCKNKKWNIEELDIYIIDTICSMHFCSSSVNQTLYDLFTKAPLSDQRTCLSLFVDKILLNDEEITIQLQDLFDTK